MTWLRRRLAAGSLRHEVVFAWSFSRQGFAAGSAPPPLDDLFRALLHTLGRKPAAALDPLALGALVLEALEGRSALLFLDGLESALDAAGRVTDVTLGLLLRHGLASATWRDTWVLATHKRPIGEESVSSALAPRWPIPPLDHPELAAFFEQIGREPTAASNRPPSALELSLRRAGDAMGPARPPEEAARAVGGRLATWLPPDAAAESSPEAAPRVSPEVRRRVRENMEELYDSPARALLLLASLFYFDPPWADLLAVIRQGRIQGAMLEPWQGLTDEAWEEALDRLLEAGLALPNDGARVALHPEVRAVLAEDLRARMPAWWAAGHRGLYEYYRDLPARHWPETLEEMAPLIVAAWHGCAAGAMQETFDEVTFPRISRGLRGFLMQELLASQWALNCLELYCPDYATAASPELRPRTLSIIIHAQAFCLRYVDRLEDALVVEERAWTRAAPTGDPMLVMPAGIGLVRLQHMFGRLGESGPVLRALFRAMLRPPPPGLEEAAALEAVTALTGMLAMVLGVKDWPTPARMLAALGLRQARGLGQPPRLTLPSYGTAWHALFLLDQGDWRRCAEADAAGEFENVTARFQVTGAIELIRVRWLTEAIKAAPAEERDALRARAEAALARGLGLTSFPTTGADGAQPRYRWWLTALRLAEGGLLAALGRPEEAVAATKTAARLAESNGFRLHQVDAALALAGLHLGLGNRPAALEPLEMARTEIGASGYRLRENALRRLWAQTRESRSR